MNMQKTTRAIVLGGGGVTGIAWEIGVLTGLLEAGIDLHCADTIIGTSAGSFVGAALASGNMEKLFSDQFKPHDSEVRVSASDDLIALWYHAFQIGGTNLNRVGLEFGKIAMKNPEPVSMESRRSVVEARLVTKEWPQTLQVTSIEANSGQLHTFNQSSGISLLDAVAASGAVPGIWPVVHFNGGNWIDGGMVSTTNARLAKGFERILILSPMPSGYGSIPGAVEDAEALSAASKVTLITPDQESVEAIGPNRYDPARCSTVATVGRTQSKQYISAVQEMW